MPVRNSALAVTLAIFAVTAFSQPSPSPEIPLRDGGRLVVRADGAMDHYDAAGRRIVMSEGVEMIARDGTRILMKNASLWRQALEAAATSYGLASTLPGKAPAGGERTIELEDGGRVVLRADGPVARYRADGTSVRPKDGDVLQAKDGTRLLVSKGTVWSPAAPGAPATGK